MWWFWLAQIFGGSPLQWAAAVGMFFGLGVGFYMLFRLAREERDER